MCLGITKAVADSTRRKDLVGRVEGQEFLIILPGCDQASASEFADRVRLEAGGNLIDIPVGPLSVNTSIGATTWSKAILPFLTCSGKQPIKLSIG